MASTRLLALITALAACSPATAPPTHSEPQFVALDGLAAPDLGLFDCTPTRNEDTLRLVESIQCSPRRSSAHPIQLIVRRTRWRANPMKTTQQWFDSQIEPAAASTPAFRVLQRGECTLAGLRALHWTWHAQPADLPAITVHERIAAFEHAVFEVRIEGPPLAYERARGQIERWIDALVVAPPY